MSGQSKIYLSIIIPVFNVREYLAQALDSVKLAASKLPDDCCVEAICIDDGSTDGSGDLLDEYAAHSSATLKFVVLHRANAGVSSARNVGLDIANGEWIGFVDGDDLVADKLFSWLYESERKYPQIEMGCFGAVRVDESLNPECRLSKEFPDTLYTNGNELLLDVRTSSWTSGIWGKFYRRAFLERIYLRFEESMKYDEDTLFAKLSLAQCSAAFVSSRMLGYLYRMRPSSAIHHKSEHMPADPLLQLKKLIALWNQGHSTCLKKLIRGQTYGLLALCKEDWYAESARKEAIEFLFYTDEIRKYIYPFVIRHDRFRTKLVLSVFLFSPRWIKRSMLRRLCSDNI